MARNFRKLFILLLMAFILAGAFASGSYAKERILRWKMATLAPRELGWAIQTRSLMIPWIKDATDDNVRFKIYWGGVMGNDHEYLQKMRIGQIQGAGLSTAGMNEACPEMTVLGLPFLLNGYDEVDHVRKAMFNTFDYYFAQNGYKLLLWIDQDFDQLYSTHVPFTKLEDFKVSKFQSWYGPLEVATFKALGASPIPMQPTEAPAGMRTGIIDSNMGPAIFQVGTQMYMKCKYLNDMKMRYSPACIALSREAWEMIPENYQKRLDDQRDSVTAKFVKGTRSDNKRAIEGMIKYGLEEVKMTPEQRQVIIDATRVVYDKMADKEYPTDLLVEVRRHLADYRAGRAPRIAKAVKAPGRKFKKKSVEEVVVEEVKEIPAEVKKVEEKIAPKMVAKAEPVKEVVAKAETLEKAPLPPAEEKQVEEAAKKTEMAEKAFLVEETADDALVEAAEKAQEGEKVVKKSSEDMLAKVEEAFKKPLEEEKKAVERIKKEAPSKTAAADRARRVSAWKQRAIAVRKVQESLKTLGYYKSRVDGIYGPITHKAIVSFQKDNGLATNGAVDKKLMDALGIEDTVLKVQTVLKEKGYYKGALDGIYGPKTAKAVRDFQKDSGVPATGAIDAKLEKSLGVN